MIKIAKRKAAQRRVQFWRGILVINGRRRGERKDNQWTEEEKEEGVISGDV